MAEAAPERLRLDKWLWFARLARTRARAVALIEAGHIRLNGQRTEQPSRAVRVGDVLTAALEGRTLVLRVAALPERREAYERARTAYEALEPGPPPPEA